MRRFLTVGVVIALILAISIPLSLTRGEGESMQGKPNTYDEEDLMARYTRDRMMYRAGEGRKITWFERIQYYEILKPERTNYLEVIRKVLSQYPRSSFAPAWQLAIATETNKLEDFQKVVSQYPGNDFIHAIAYTKMGEIYRSKGKDTEAEASFQKALSLIDKCIKNEPGNAAYNYQKAIIKLKQRDEPLDWVWEEGLPVGQSMPADIFFELKEGANKDYCYTPYLELNNINENIKSMRELARGLIIQSAYYGRRGEIDKEIETAQIKLKIGKHYWDENQNLAVEAKGLSMWIYGQLSLYHTFKRNNMIEEKEKSEIALKVAQERMDRIGQINYLACVYAEVIVNKNLSRLPPEAQADPEKTIRELKEEMIDIIEKNNLIKDKNLEVRIFISYLLSRIGGERAITILKEGLDDKDPYVRFFVRKLLEEINPTE